MGTAASERGVELRGLQKTYRSPGGPVHAVRGIDVVVDRGET
jgi:ABC-2 type transport system ATP-binding protein